MVGDLLPYSTEYTTPLLEYHTPHSMHSTPGDTFARKRQSCLSPHYHVVYHTPGVPAERAGTCQPRDSARVPYSFQKNNRKTNALCVRATRQVCVRCLHSLRPEIFSKTDVIHDSIQLFSKRLRGLSLRGWEVYRSFTSCFKPSVPAHSAEAPTTANAGERMSVAPTAPTSVANGVTITAPSLEVRRNSLLLL